jgi:hypothetical protein
MWGFGDENCPILGEKTVGIWEIIVGIWEKTVGIYKNCPILGKNCGNLSKLPHFEEKIAMIHSSIYYIKNSDCHVQYLS